MRSLTLNIVLALVWCLLTASLRPWNFVAGLIVGAAVVNAYGSVSGQRSCACRCSSTAITMRVARRLVTATV